MPLRGADLDPLAVRDRRPPAAERVDRDEPVVVHVRDREPDHVEVREEREQRAVAAPGTPRDEVPDRVGLDLGDVADALADGVEGKVLVPGRAVGTQQRVEQRRESHPAESRLWLVALPRDPHRPPHAARRVPAPARRRRRELPARVGRAGPARPPLLHRRRLAARLVRGGGGARRCRWSATSPTTTWRSSSRPCRCPTDGPGLPESRFVVADTLVRFDHGSGTASVLAGDPDEIAERLGARTLCCSNTSSPRTAQPSGAKRT